MADYSFLAGLGSGLSELGTQLTRRQIEKQAKEERDLERQRQKERDALDKQMNVLRERQTLESMNYDANAPEPVVPNAINGMGGQEDAMKKLLATHSGDQYISGIDGTRYTRAEGQRPNEIKQEHEKAMAAIRAQAAKDLDAVKGERDTAKAQLFEGGRNMRAQGAQDGALQRIQISVDGQRASNANSVGGANDRAEQARAMQGLIDRNNFIEARTKPVPDGFGGFSPPQMTIPDAIAAWDQINGKGGPVATPQATRPGFMGPPTPQAMMRQATDDDVMAAMKAVGNDPAKVRAYLATKGLRE